MQVVNFVPRVILFAHIFEGKSALAYVFFKPFTLNLLLLVIILAYTDVKERAIILQVLCIQ